VVVLSYIDPEKPRIFRDVECGYGDVLLNSAEDVYRHLSIRECINVLRAYDHEEASRLYQATSDRPGQLRRDAYWEATERIYKLFEDWAEDGSEYQQQTMEDIVTMAKPEPKGASQQAGPKPGKENGEKKPREKKSQYNPEHKISLLTDKEGKQYGASNNPKRGKAAERFAKYKHGMTVKQALDAGVTSGDLNWDVGRKFISIGG